MGNKETCEVLLDYPKKGGGGIKDFIGKAIMNLLHDHIEMYSNILNDEFPREGIKCIENFSHIVPT